MLYLDSDPWVLLWRAERPAPYVAQNLLFVPLPYRLDGVHHGLVLPVVVQYVPQRKDGMFPQV